MRLLRMFTLYLVGTLFGTSVLRTLAIAENARRTLVDRNEAVGDSRKLNHAPARRGFLALKAKTTPGFEEWHQDSVYDNNQGVIREGICYTTKNCPPPGEEPVANSYWWDVTDCATPPSPIGGSCVPTTTTTLLPLFPGFIRWDGQTVVDNGQAVQHEGSCFSARNCPAAHKAPSHDSLYYRVIRCDSPTTPVLGSCIPTTTTTVYPLYPGFARWDGQTVFDNNQGVQHEGICYITKNCPPAHEVPPQDEHYWVETMCSTPPTPIIGSCRLTTTTTLYPLAPGFTRWDGQTTFDNGQGVQYNGECYVTKNCPPAHFRPTEDLRYWDNIPCGSPPTPVHGSCVATTTTTMYPLFPGFMRWDGNTVFDNNQGVQHEGICYITKNCPPANEVPPKDEYYWIETMCATPPTPIVGSCIPTTTTTMLPLHPGFVRWNGVTVYNNGQGVQHKGNCYMTKNCPPPYEEPVDDARFWDQINCDQPPTPVLGSCIATTTTTRYPVFPGFLRWDGVTVFDNNQGVQHEAVCYVTRNCPPAHEEPPKDPFYWEKITCDTPPAPMVGSCVPTTTTTVYPLVPGFIRWDGVTVLENNQGVQHGGVCYTAKNCPPAHIVPGNDERYWTPTECKDPPVPVIGSCTGVTTTTSICPCQTTTIPPTTTQAPTTEPTTTQAPTTEPTTTQAPTTEPTTTQAPTTKPTTTQAPTTEPTTTQAPSCPPYTGPNLLDIVERGPNRRRMTDVAPGFIRWDGVTTFNNNQGVLHEGICYIAKNCPPAHEIPPQDERYWEETRCDTPPTPVFGSCGVAAPGFVLWDGVTTFSNNQGVQHESICYIAKNCPPAHEVPPQDERYWEETRCDTPPRPVFGSCGVAAPGFVKWDGVTTFNNNQGVQHEGICYITKNCPPAHEIPPQDERYWEETRCDTPPTPVVGSCVPPSTVRRLLGFVSDRR